MLAEGEVMIQALTRDLLALPEVAVSLVRDCRATAWRELHNPRLEDIRVSSEHQFRATWLEALGRCDAAWVIAPETRGILEQLCHDVESSGRASLTCPATAVRLLANKEKTVRRLAAHGIRTVPTRRASAVSEPDSFPVVVKPIDGAGCSGSRILSTAADWKHFQLDGNPERQVVQPLLCGDALSLSVLFDHGRSRLVSCNRQHVREMDQRFVLDACTVNIVHPERTRFEELAQQIALAVPELSGYAGIDFIHDREGPAVLEINPRLTTSYAGLHQALGVNPARWICDLRLRGILPDQIPAGERSVTIDVGQPCER